MVIQDCLQSTTLLTDKALCPVDLHSDHGEFLSLVSLVSGLSFQDCSLRILILRAQQVTSSDVLVFNNVTQVQLYKLKRVLIQGDLSTDHWDYLPSQVSPLSRVSFLEHLLSLTLWNWRHLHPITPQALSKCQGQSA